MDKIVAGMAIVEVFMWQ